MDAGLPMLPSSAAKILSLASGNDIASDAYGDLFRRSSLIGRSLSCCAREVGAV
jgi:hypothetical protein